MSQSAQWVAVTLDAIAAQDNTSDHDGLDLRQAAAFIRDHEDEFNEQCVEDEVGVALVASFTTLHQKDLQAIEAARESSETATIAGIPDRVHTRLEALEEAREVSDEAAGEE